MKNGVKIFHDLEDVKMNKFHNLVALKLKQIDPAAFEECISFCKPKIKIFNLIPIVASEILSSHPYTAQNRPLVLASIYWLFAPWKIIQHDSKLPVGMRDYITSSLKISHPETISMDSQNIDVYWKNPRFRAKVIALTDKIYNELAKAGYLEEGAWQTD